MTERELARLCRLWQKRLRLLDWQVVVRIAPESELPENLGDGDIDGYEQRATIRIREGAEMEGTLVHELLHLRLLPWGVDDNDERQTAMNLLADAFIRLTRRKRCTKTT